MIEKLTRDLASPHSFSSTLSLRDIPVLHVSTNPSRLILCT